MTIRVLVPLAAGFEEIEAITVIDVLRRAGAEVIVAGLEPGPIRASRGIQVTADRPLAGLVTETFQAIVLPGGMPGAEHLAASSCLQQLIRRAKESGTVLGAICAAPAVVLRPLGVLEGRKGTCHPNFRDQLPEHVDSAVVIDGDVITSQGPGTAMAFSLALVTRLFGAGKTRQLEQQMCIGVE